MTQRPKKQKHKKQPAVSDSRDESVSHDATPVKGWVRIWQSDFAIVVILIAAYLLRSIALEIKPPHFDEGINGFFVTKLWKEGYYHYDPNNFHGPLYFYFLQLAELLFGRSIVGFRFVTGLISLSCVVVIALHRRFFGPAAGIAALVCAISTGMVFYSRYAIHESLFILCLVLFSYGFFLWQEERSRKALAFMVAGVVASYTVKETFFIFFGTWAIAVFCVRIFQRWSPRPWPIVVRPGGRDGEPSTFWASRASGNDILVFSCYGALAAVALFTGFFLNRSGYQDMFSTFMIWTKTGTGKSGHEKEWWYWLDLLWRYEWPSLAALGLSLPMFFYVGVRERIVCLTAFGTWLAYTLIPYKTPWLILNMTWLLAFVFGFACVRLARVRLLSLRLFLALLAVVALVRSGATMARINFEDFTNAKEPYVYVQSTLQMKRVLDLIDTKVKERPEAQNMRLYVLVKDPWPLPWVFSTFPNLIWGTPETSDFKDANVIMVDASKQAITEARLTSAKLAKFWRIPFQIRDSYEPGFAYFDFETFKGLVPSDSAIVGQEGAKP